VFWEKNLGEDIGSYSSHPSAFFSLSSSCHLLSFQKYTQKHKNAPGRVKIVKNDRTYHRRAREAL